MYQKLTLILLIFLFSFSCAKEKPVSIPYDENKAMEIYVEAVEAMNRGDYFFASKKFSEAENILPEVEQSAKAALMSSYCLYLINFHQEASENLELAVEKVLKNGFRTVDLISDSSNKKLGCKEMGEEILKVLEDL